MGKSATCFKHETSVEQLIRKNNQNYSSVYEDVLDAALNSDATVVEMFLKVNPGYLLVRGSATHFSGRKYSDLTVLQAAIISGNVQTPKMIKKHFERIPGGLGIMENQLLEIYKQSIRVHIKSLKDSYENIPKIMGDISKIHEMFGEFEAFERIMDGQNLDAIIKFHDEIQQKDIFEVQWIMEKIKQASKKDCRYLNHRMWKKKLWHPMHEHDFVQLDPKRKSKLVKYLIAFTVMLESKVAREVIPSLHRYSKALLLEKNIMIESSGGFLGGCCGDDEFAEYDRRYLIREVVFLMIEHCLPEYERKILIYRLYYEDQNEDQNIDIPEFPFNYFSNKVLYCQDRTRFPSDVMTGGWGGDWYIFHHNWKNYLEQKQKMLMTSFEGLQNYNQSTSIAAVSV